jgi:hypothetical protein
MEWYGEMGHGKLWRSRRGRAWSIGVGSGVAWRSGMVRNGLARHGAARRGGQGAARSGAVRSGG